MLALSPLIAYALVPLTAAQAGQKHRGAARSSDEQNPAGGREGATVRAARHGLVALASPASTFAPTLPVTSPRSSRLASTLAAGFFGAGWTGSPFGVRPSFLRERAVRPEVSNGGGAEASQPGSKPLASNSYESWPVVSWACASIVTWCLPARAGLQ